MIECQKIKAENEELKKEVAMWQKTFMSAGIEVDEKFGDKEEDVRIPSMKDVKGFRDDGVLSKEENVSFEEDTEEPEEDEEYDDD